PARRYRTWQRPRPAARAARHTQRGPARLSRIVLLAGEGNEDGQGPPLPHHRAGPRRGDQAPSGAGHPPVDIRRTDAGSWMVLTDPEGDEFCVVRPGHHWLLSGLAREFVGGAVHAARA